MTFSVTDIGCTFDYIKYIKWHFSIVVEWCSTQELTDKIQEVRFFHTNLKGEINWKDGDEIEVQIAGTFAKENLSF